MKRDIDKRIIRKIATDNGWNEIKGNDSMLSFKKNDNRINVYYTTGTVATCLNHPKRGKTQLFRRNVGAGMLERIFRDPRIHTGKGYYSTMDQSFWSR